MRAPDRIPVPQRGARRFARRATLRRAAGLLNDFRFEQTDPERFYSALARDSVELIADLYPDPLDGAVVVDVGGGPGYFADGFRARGARYVSVEPDPAEMHAAALPHQASIRASGMDLPFADRSLDVCFSSNVAEHVPDPWRMGSEMLRVTRSGGIMVLSYTLWYGPFGGHEMGLTHYLGGARAARLYTRRHGHPPKNLYGTSLFPVTAAAGLRWAATVSADQASLIAAFPRYLPRWMWWVMRVPGLRELLGSNLVLVFRRK